MEGLGQLAKSVANSVEVLPLIYKDLAQPGVQKVGRALETVLDLGNTVLLPIKLANERTKYWFKKHMDSYREKLDSVPYEAICDVPPEIGVPILDKLTYTTSEDSADLFTTLLTKASSVETAGQVHPSFASIMSNLSVDEASIIKFIDSDILYTSGRLYIKEKEGFFEINRHLTGIEFKVDLVFPENAPAYMQNLVTLGILSDMEGTYKIDELRYENLRSQYSIEETCKTEFGDKFDHIEWNNSYFKINNFGRMFINACKR